MTDHFTAAERRAHHFARRLLRDGIPPDVIADAMITNGLAAWAAGYGRARAANFLVRVWVKIRDRANGL